MPSRVSQGCEQVGDFIAVILYTTIFFTPRSLKQRSYIVVILKSHLEMNELQFHAHVFHHAIGHYPAGACAAGTGNLVCVGTCCTWSHITAHKQGSLCNYLVNTI